MGNGLCAESAGSWSVFDWFDKILGPGGVGNFLNFKIRHDDDFADRLSHQYTFILLMIFTVFTGTSHYVGHSIDCWCPAQFTKAHVDYTNSVCWVSNTYHLPFSERIPIEGMTVDERKQEGEVSYYQWVPIIFLGMAFAFKLPRVVWKVLTGTATLNLDRMIQLLMELQTANSNEKREKLLDMSEYMQDWLETAKLYSASFCLSWRQRVSKYSCFICGRRYGNFFMAATLFIKIYYFANILVLFLLLNNFLGSSFSTFGFDVMGDLSKNDPSQQITQSPRFPRVTMCDFQLRQLQNVQSWTVQCVLPINNFNEKFFLFIWYWMVLLMIASAISLARLVYGFMFPFKRIAVIKKYLVLRDVYKGDTPSEKRLLKKFVMNYLKFDGVHIVNVLNLNASEVMTADVVAKVWENYKQKYGSTVAPESEY